MDALGEKPARGIGHEEPAVADESARIHFRRVHGESPARFHRVEAKRSEAEHGVNRLLVAGRPASGQNIS